MDTTHFEGSTKRNQSGNSQESSSLMASIDSSVGYIQVEWGERH